MSIKIDSIETIAKLFRIVKCTRSNAVEFYKIQIQPNTVADLDGSAWEDMDVCLPELKGENEFISFEDAKEMVDGLVKYLTDIF